MRWAQPNLGLPLLQRKIIGQVPRNISRWMNDKILYIPRIATVYKGNIIKFNNGLPILRRDTAQTRLVCCALPGASPALAAASYPFVDLPPRNTLRCKLFPSGKFTIHLFPKLTGHSIIEPATNRTFMEVIRMFQELGISAGTAIIILIALYFIIKWSVKNGIKEAYKI